MEGGKGDIPKKEVFFPEKEFFWIIIYVKRRGGCVAAFTEVTDVCTFSRPGGNWTFSEATGVLEFSAAGDVPEPASALLLLLGVGALRRYGRRRGQMAQ